MAFNLKKVLKALLFSSSDPLGIKDIQAAFTRFHETDSMFREEQADEDRAVTGAATGDGTAVSEGAAAAEGAASDAPGAGAEPVPAPTADLAALTGAQTGNPTVVTESAEIIAEPADDPELYADVPSLITATQIREVMDEIAAELRAADDGMLLIEGGNGYRIVTHPRFARWVRILRSEPPPVKLSQSAIETLAIVAYRQPVTRGEIETIRGVSAEAGINKLLERELVYVVGRADLPGRPIQYGTTDKFLEFVGVKSLDELPASDVLSSRQIDEWLKTAMNPTSLSDTDMGLADEQLPLEGPATGEPAAEQIGGVDAATTQAEVSPAEEAPEEKSETDDESNSAKN
jgi:segregation and condensation protein B